MILVDTSVWIQHLRATEPALVHLLDAGRVLSHPQVTGEIALGNLAARSEVLSLLHGLPHADVASDSEVLHLIEVKRLYGRGIGYVDSHLLAATRITADAHLWTRDKLLHTLATELDVAYAPPEPTES